MNDENVTTCTFDACVPDAFTIIPKNKKIIESIYPLKKDEALLVVVNIEGEEMGGDFEGLPLYTGRCASALDGDGSHILVVDKEIKNNIEENLKYLKSTKVIKDDPVKIIGINMTDEPFTFKALLKDLQKESKKGKGALIDEMKKVKRILPFICSYDMANFIKGAKKLGFDNFYHEGTVKGAELVNNKGLTITKKLKEKNINVPDGIICHSKKDTLKAYEILSHKYGTKLVYKKSRSASGVGFSFIDSEEDLKKILDKRVFENDYKKGIIIEERIKNIVSFPGVVIDVKPGKRKGEPYTTLVGISDQLFLEDEKGNYKDSVVHMGNIWPIEENRWSNDVWDAVLEYAKWMDEAGAYGISGLDLAVCYTKDELKTYAMDPNCRITGSVHPALILHNIFGSSRSDDIAWLSDNNFTIPKNMSLKEFVNFLRKNNLEFVNEKGKREGVIVANHATNPLGKTQVIFVKSVDEKMTNKDKRAEVIKLWNRARDLMKEYMESETDLVDLTKKLIQFKSTHDNHDGMEEIFYFCKKKLERRGVLINEFSSDFHRSLVATFRKTKEPKIMLMGHLDVVPADDSDFEPVEKLGRLYGRGAGDMKSAVAVLIETFNYFAKKRFKPSLGIMLTTDEELGGQNGSKYLLDVHNYKCDIALVPDSSSGLNEIVVHQKGALHARIKAKGKSSHGSRPSLGVNAIDNLLDMYKELRKVIPFKDGIKYGNTLSLTRISGGEQVNQIPDCAEMSLDIRYPDSKKFQPFIEKIQKVSKGNLDVLYMSEPFKISKDQKWIKKYKKIAEKYLEDKVTFIKEYGSSDATHFAQKNIPVIVTGLKKGNVHSENEWVTIKEIYLFSELLKEFIEEFA